MVILNALSLVLEFTSEALIVKLDVVSDPTAVALPLIT